ncbi:DNA-binding protein RFX8 [Balearica regulorum gibbericeps]|uniref:DNA-binding protein RFX8 n=1 Tax=Balearica regulorum gibbericeps TaxID=100784 RepID=UPI003F61AA2C
MHKELSTNSHVSFATVEPPSSSCATHNSFVALPYHGNSPQPQKWPGLAQRFFLGPRCSSGGMGEAELRHDKTCLLELPKLIRLVFPGLGTRRLGTRGSTRYHYDGIAIKKNSSFYARYCSLLSEKKYHRHRSPGEASSSAWQLSTSAGTGGNACSSGDAAGYRSNSQKKRTSKNLHCSPSVIYLKTEQERFQYPWPEFSRFYLWEQELGKKYPYEMVVLLANEYCSYCQDILHMVRKTELDKVEDCIISFWRSLQPERIALMSLPDVCQLLQSYDRQLFKEIENILLHDFLEEVPVQHMKLIRLFCKNVEIWLLNALKDFPLPLQTSKSKELTVFKKRLRRKTDLSNMAKTMRTVLNSNSKVTVLRSDLHAVMNQGFLDVPGNLFQMKFRNPEELQNDIELKYIRVLLNCVFSNLQAFVIQPSRSKEEFRKLASDFQLRWNFLLSAVSKAMTLNYADSFEFCTKISNVTCNIVGNEEIRSEFQDQHWKHNVY